MENKLNLENVASGPYILQWVDAEGGQIGIPGFGFALKAVNQGFAN